MSSIFNWMRINKGWAALIIIIITVFLFLGIPVIISAYFLDDGGIPVDWEAKDFLLFYGSFLAFIGTSV